MTPEQEAAQIMTRILESLARASGKTLKPSTRADIVRMCELLASSGAEYDQLDDLPKATPGEAAVNLVAMAEADPNFKRWKEDRDRRAGRE
jgi:hypothetical protein